MYYVCIIVAYVYVYVYVCICMHNWCSHVCECVYVHSLLPRLWPLQLFVAYCTRNSMQQKAGEEPGNEAMCALV